MSAFNFPDSFFLALGEWQNGWAEDQSRRVPLAVALANEARALPPEFCKVRVPCYRKRFLQSKDVIPLLLRSLHDGVTSWSIDRKTAEEFKYRMRPGTITGVVFKHEPSDSNVVLNIPALWADSSFASGAEAYRDREMLFADALFNFREERDQFEVVLDAPLNPEDIVTLTGETNTSFEEFCRAVGLPVLLEDSAWKALLDKDLQPQAPSFLRDEAAQTVILHAVERLEHLLDKAHAN
jgi:hypothetical protein